MNKVNISEGTSTVKIEYVVEQVKLGDKQKYTIIINRFQKQIYLYCYYLLGNKEDAEDAVQDIFIKGFENMDKFTNNTSYSAWLYKIAYNHCINLIKRRSRFYNVLKQYKNQEFQMREPNHTEIIHELLDQLNSEEKHILLLRAVEEYTFEEISIIMDIKAATIRKKYERIRKKLHQFIKKKGGNCIWVNT
ncbi:MAG TPA: RNA polymerase sigma factor [Bacillus bacterium]|nr:RNA polymerase sigma factor [Bacillus sp. (in: firmicutes)]